MARRAPRWTRRSSTTHRLRGREPIARLRYHLVVPERAPPGLFGFERRGRERAAALLHERREERLVGGIAMQAGAAVVRLGGAEEARGFLPVLTERGETRRHLHDAEAHALRADRLRNRDRLQEHLARRVLGTPADRRHCQVEQADGDALPIVELARELDGVAIEELRLVE